MPSELCGSLSTEEISLWELSSKVRSEQLIAEWQAKKQPLKQTHSADEPAAQRD